MRTEHYLEYIIYGFAILFTVLALLIFCRILRFCVNYLRYLVFNPNNDIATSTSLTKNNKKKDCKQGCTVHLVEVTSRNPND
mgnify:CR=1 FL=1